MRRRRKQCQDLREIDLWFLLELQRFGAFGLTSEEDHRDDLLVEVRGRYRRVSSILNVEILQDRCHRTDVSSLGENLLSTS